ncbi:hypothetical protein HYV30_03110 [Candidatus Kaiserbacteria bacterium]|nr:hypothetical protein [Candidatus Kaiserbacteria bacterium]
MSSFFVSAAAASLVLISATGSFAGLAETNACKARSLAANNLTERSARRMKAGVSYRIAGPSGTTTYVFSRGDTVWGLCERISSAQAALGALPAVTREDLADVRAELGTLRAEIGPMKKIVDNLKKAELIIIPDSPFLWLKVLLILVLIALPAVVLAAAATWFLLRRSERPAPVPVYIPVPEPVPGSHVSTEPRRRFAERLVTVVNTEPQVGDAVAFFTNPARQVEGGTPHCVIAHIAQLHKGQREGRPVTICRGTGAWNGPYFDLALYDLERQERVLLTAGMARALANGVRSAAHGEPNSIGVWLSQTGWRFKTEEECPEHILLQEETKFLPASEVPAEKAAQPVA